MTNAKQFHIASILSVTHGYLISTNGMDGIYAVLNHVTGDNLMTHQLPRAMDETRDAILAQLPQSVATLTKEDMSAKIEQAKAEHGDLWHENLVANLEDAYGMEFSLRQVDTYRVKDPVDEMLDMTNVEESEG